MIVELKPIFDKAMVTCDTVLCSGLQELRATGERHLYSYNTHVAYIDNDQNVHLLPEWDYSATTLRHVKEFLKQNGFRAENKKQIQQDYFN